MDPVAIDQVLEKIRQHLNLSKQTERELLDEIRTHLEDVMAEAASYGRDESLALRKAAEEFGIDEVGIELQQVHKDWESLDAILLCALPVLFALVLRWLVFAPDGTALDWPQLLVWPGFWVAAAAALIIPALYFTRWRLVLFSWLFFWLLTVIFVVFPSIHHW